jgi:hypothetical protein
MNKIVETLDELKEILTTIDKFLSKARQAVSEITKEQKNTDTKTNEINE